MPVRLVMNVAVRSERMHRLEGDYSMRNPERIHLATQQVSRGAFSSALHRTNHTQSCSMKTASRFPARLLEKGAPVCSHITFPSLPSRVQL